jgi:hypothetical protein
MELNTDMVSSLSARILRVSFDMGQDFLHGFRGIPERFGTNLRQMVRQVFTWTLLIFRQVLSMM